MGRVYSEEEKARIKLAVNLGDGQGVVEHPVWNKNRINWPVVDRFIKQQSAHMTDEAMAQALKINRSVLTIRRNKMGIPPYRSKRIDWSAIDPFIMGMSTSIASETFNIPQTTIYRRKQKLKAQRRSK